MALLEKGRLALTMAILAVGVGAAGLSVAEDWRKLRLIDLPATLVQATWSDGRYLSEGHGVQLGRMSIYLQPRDTTKKVSVSVARNGGDGIVIENLTCYNTIMGASGCTLLLDRPRFCHLFFDLKGKVPDTERFDLECPADLTLGN